MFGIFDIGLNADIPLPELPKIASANATIDVVSGVDFCKIPDKPEWYHHWKTPDGEVCISCAKLGDDFQLRYPGLADFIISASGNLVQYFSESNVPTETIRHLLLDQIIPRLLGQQGRLVLHASAIKISAGPTIAFLGASGSGKSTLASFFHQQGAELITDDCLLLDVNLKSVVAIPNYYGVRLFDDSASAIFGAQTEGSHVAHYTTKRRLRLPVQDASEPVVSGYPLSAIILLVDPGETGSDHSITLSPITGANEFIAIVEQTFLLDATDKRIIAHHFEHLRKLILSGIDIYRLAYPRDYSVLPLVQARIRQAL